MHFFTAHRARHHFHGAACIGAPRGHGDAYPTAVAGGKQSCVPAQQALLRQWLVKVAGSVQHHVYHAVHMPVAGGQSANVQPEPAGDGRTHGVLVEALAFYLTGFDDFLRQHLQGGLFALGDAQLCHAPHELALRPMDLGQRCGKRGCVIGKVRPIG